MLFFLVFASLCVCMYVNVRARMCVRCECGCARTFVSVCVCALVVLCVHSYRTSGRGRVWVLARVSSGPHTHKFD